MTPPITEAEVAAEREAIVRLAELWYHAEGFMEMAKGGRLPDPPAWIESALADDHSGDCTKQPWSCMHCHADEFVAMAQWVYPRFRAHLEQQGNPK